MDCGSVMRVTETKLYADAPLGTAIDFMYETHMGLVPVVDRNEVFVGQLSGDRLMNALLPHSLTMIRGLDRMSYLRESREELRERLDELRNHAIADVMERDVPTVTPDTPLVKALQMLSHKYYVVPVVEKGTGRLLGAISFFSVLRALTENGT